MSNKINIKRPYFNSNEYGKVIDNSFRELNFSKTGSISDFTNKFLQELPNMSPEVLDFFIRQTAPYLRTDKPTDYEIRRLKETITGSLEAREIPQTKEHPIIPNGSFFRDKDPLNNGNKGKVRLKNIKFWYMQEGLLRYLQPGGVFEQLFKSITGKDPYDDKGTPEIWKYTSEVKPNFLNSLPQGKDITADSLGEETPETDIRYK
jgi:hypothetical protein